MMHSVKALVVDDDPICLLLMEAILARLGVVVTTEKDPQLALDSLLTDPDRFDLLVTDYQMPGLDGIELATCIARKLPDLPIVMVSSCLEDALERIDDDLFDAKVAKPFGELELSAALCEALDERSQIAGESGTFAF